jgi:hypothetical protein
MCASYSGGTPVLNSVSNPLVNNLDADGNDLTNVGAADVGSLSADELAHNLEDGSDLSGSRSFNTEYQNTSGQTLRLTIIINVSAAGDTFAAALESSNSSPVDFADQQDFARRNADTDSDRYVATAVIPDGAYYKFESSIERWFERGYV